VAFFGGLFWLGGRMAYGIQNSTHYMNVKGGQKDANQQNKKPTKNLKTKNNHTHKQ
jgi:hypothetical protein